MTAGEKDPQRLRLGLPGRFQVEDHGQEDRAAGTRCLQPVSKYVITSLMERWDGSWMVLKYELHADQPC